MARAQLMLRMDFAQHLLLTMGWKRNTLEMIFNIQCQIVCYGDLPHTKAKKIISLSYYRYLMIWRNQTVPLRDAKTYHLSNTESNRTAHPKFKILA